MCVATSFTVLRLRWRSLTSVMESLISRAVFDGVSPSACMDGAAGAAQGLGDWRGGPLRGLWHCAHCS